MTRRSRHPDDRGAATVLVTVAAGVTLAFGLAAVLVGQAVRASAQARTAADLAALAGADAGAAGRDACAAAATVARANRARLVACLLDIAGAVTVVAEVTAPGAGPPGTVRARARAEPGAPGP
ncbi:MAG TPA: Rv3654c family TadE-like protein [Frankiaceae bacterium]|nr:Rv3654c family TadE-like protein [Frankiaceae bacterium]